MKRKYKKATLEKKLEKLKEKLFQEKLRLHGVIDDMGFGHAMRCCKTTPNFRREDELNAKIEACERLLAEYKEQTI